MTDQEHTPAATSEDHPVGAWQPVAHTGELTPSQHAPVIASHTPWTFAHDGSDSPGLAAKTRSGRAKAAGMVAGGGVLIFLKVGVHMAFLSLSLIHISEPTRRTP